MKTAGSICALLVLFARGEGAENPKSSNERDPWNGFSVGSWVIRATSLTKDGMTTSSREKQTRTEKKDSDRIELTVLKEAKAEGVFNGETSTRWHVAGYDPALDPKCKLLDTSKQDLTIQEKKYPCDVKKYEMSNGEEKAIVTFWHCKDVSMPYRELGVDPRTLAMRPDVLRLDVDFKAKGSSEKSSIRVVNFTEVREIGKKKIVCVREEGEVDHVEGEMKAKGTIVRWLSNEVPGREVQLIAETEFGGKKFKKEERIEAFEVVKGK